MEWEALLKIFLAMVFGGIIGLEREIGNRPAGFRTHTLVCMGSALVMLTSEYLINTYSDLSIPDPARLGAQVISGIGFLGAGTIIKDGSRVRGLTTAASLWVVACIGIAIGAGFYWGALIAAVFSYITLFLLKKFEGFMTGLRGYDLQVELLNKPGQIARVTGVLGSLNISIRDIKIMPGEDEWAVSRFKIVMPKGLSEDVLLAELDRLEGVRVCDEPE